MWYGDHNLGDVIYFNFDTYSSDDPAASITLTGLAVTDIEIYKNGNMTQRASDVGYTLLDTDGIDLDSTTGHHGFSVDTGDDTDSGFWVSDAMYDLVVNAVTVDGATVVLSFQFSIGKTTAAMSASLVAFWEQAGVVLASGTIGDTGNSSAALHLEGLAYADDDLNGCTIVVEDNSSGLKYSSCIKDWVAATDLATLEKTLPFTPQNDTDRYWVLGFRSSQTYGFVPVVSA